ncbi:hypothetical protein C8R46DRAFT_1057053 [Mycena filopes]|nr:hypothetical protein C8R46DRAFT_1057053 [Mycena filopes]
MPVPRRLDRPGASPSMIFDGHDDSDGDSDTENEREFGLGLEAFPAFTRRSGGRGGRGVVFPGSPPTPAGGPVPFLPGAAGTTSFSTSPRAESFFTSTSTSPSASSFPPLRTESFLASPRTTTEDSAAAALESEFNSMRRGGGGRGGGPVLARMRDIGRHLDVLHGRAAALDAAALDVRRHIEALRPGAASRASGSTSVGQGREREGGGQGRGTNLHWAALAVDVDLPPRGGTGTALATPTWHEDTGVPAAQLEEEERNTARELRRWPEFDALNEQFRRERPPEEREREQRRGIDRDFASLFPDLGLGRGVGMGIGTHPPGLNSETEFESTPFAEVAARRQARIQAQRQEQTQSQTDMLLWTRSAIAEERARLVEMQGRLAALGAAARGTNANAVSATTGSADANASADGATTTTTTDASTTPTTSPTLLADIRQIVREQTELLARVGGLVAEMGARVAGGAFDGLNLDANDNTGFGAGGAGGGGGAATMLARAREALERAERAVRVRVPSDGDAALRRLGLEALYGDGAGATATATTSTNATTTTGTTAAAAEDEEDKRPTPTSTIRRRVFFER